MNAKGTLARSAVLLGAQAAVAGVLVIGTASPALAATRDHGGVSATASSSTPTGNDISYPQCGHTFPAAPAFGIVGVNDGLANNLNPCLGPSSSYPSYTQSELYWAVATATGATSQPKAQLYVNTADPGNVYRGTVIADWPKSGSDPQYGTCSTTKVGRHILGQNSPACAWQYGYNRAAQDVAWLSSKAKSIDAYSPPIAVSAAASGYPWWLDVETGNTWQTGSSGLAMNVADLQGMIYQLQSVGAAVGAYSTSYQWGQITGGTTSASGSLYGIPDWIPGASSLAGAQSNCTLTSFTGGTIPVTQWFASPYDGDNAC